jgi:hypothetical protein
VARGGDFCGFGGGDDLCRGVCGRLFGERLQRDCTQPVGLSVNPAYRGPINADPEFPRTLSTDFMPGLKIGTWFVKNGFLGFDYPDWMKYFSFY